ncbi:MAG: FdrA family protein [Alkaliphilus sp.]|nr:acyl-CoA synthetase FdrA [bacterium AH-315-L21]PHS34797.1 MAG: FdrA family protein [Alkaliphilus sp.]
MFVAAEIKKNTYYDSVYLMRITKEIEKTEGVIDVLVGMGTELNKELVSSLSMMTKEIESLGPNDFFVVAKIKREEIMGVVTKKIDSLMNEKKKNNVKEHSPATLDSALKYNPEINFALISLPGEYAIEEAKKALEKNLHVMLFSDNISVEKEIELKLFAKQKGLLMMGPDCGTAIINGIPLAFANEVSRGNIGIISASGTGAQEVSVLIDKLGSGISQLIGTGGRDLKDEIGGITMIQAIEALEKDENTKIIVLISKPPSENVAEKIFKMLNNSKKNYVVNFIGSESKNVSNSKTHFAYSLEETAKMAVELANKSTVRNKEVDAKCKKAIEELKAKEKEAIASAKNMVGNLSVQRKYMRGLFTGGTLALEAMNILRGRGMEVYSNLAGDERFILSNANDSYRNACVDLGDDVFTRGRPHPMIEPSIRNERLIKEIRDEDVLVILMDCVLGYGSHENPAGEIANTLNLAKKDMTNEENDSPIIVVSIIGTNKDPQNLKESIIDLENAGAIVVFSTAQATRIVAEITKSIGEC